MARLLEDLLSSLAEAMFPDDDRLGLVTLQSKNCENETPLHIYLWRGDNEAAQTLVSSGADVNAIGDMGETPLHVAVRTCDVDTLAVLFVAKARTDIVSDFGQTPRQLAESVGRSEVFDQAEAQARKRQGVRLGKKRDA